MASGRRPDPTVRSASVAEIDCCRNRILAARRIGRVLFAYLVPQPWSRPLPATSHSWPAGGEDAPAETETR